MKSRLQSLGLVDRAFRSAADDEIATAVEAMGDDHKEAVERLAGGTGVDDIRAAASKGRIDGTMESLAVVVSDACLADCIDKLGADAEHPSTDQLREILPGIVERHGLGVTRLMLASTVAGEADASAIIRDLLKNDDLVKLPPSEPTRIVSQFPQSPTVDSSEREIIKAKRLESRRRRQEAAAARRQQSKRDRSR